MGATSFSGSVAAILLNTPGIAPNAATCFDGYPLAQQGKAGMAIGAAAAASSTGGLISVFTLIAIIPVAKLIVYLLVRLNSSCWLYSDYRRCGFDRWCFSARVN